MELNLEEIVPIEEQHRYLVEVHGTFRHNVLVWSRNAEGAQVKARKQTELLGRGLDLNLTTPKTHMVEVGQGLAKLVDLQEE